MSFAKWLRTEFNSGLCKLAESRASTVGLAKWLRTEHQLEQHVLKISYRELLRTVCA